MLKKTLIAAAVAFGAMSSAHASYITMEGNYILTAVSDNGTLGAGGTTSPGILHDVTGTSSWSVDDYLTPGTPFEGFYVSTDQTGINGNNNAGTTTISGTSTDTSATSGYDQSVIWTGDFGSYFSIDISTYFNDGDERISFSTTITALQDLTGLEFLRVLDPDPDVNTYRSYDTVNGRGNGTIAEEDWVHAEGSSTGLTIGYYSDSDVEHNTGISTSWSTDPSFYLNGTDDGDGDNTIGIAFDLGDLLAGESITFDYYAVMGDSLDTVALPTTTVPEPASLALFGLGLGGLGLSRMRKKRKC